MVGIAFELQCHFDVRSYDAFQSRSCGTAYNYDTPEHCGFARQFWAVDRPRFQVQIAAISLPVSGGRVYLLSL